MPYLLRLSSDTTTAPVEFLTMGEVALLCGKSTDALKKLTQKGILPDANFRTQKILIKNGERQGEYIDGYRLYSKNFLVPKLAPYIKKNIMQVIQITRHQRLDLIDMFNEEREQLLQK